MHVVLEYFLRILGFDFQCPILHMQVIFNVNINLKKRGILDVYLLCKSNAKLPKAKAYTYTATLNNQKVRWEIG